MRRQDKQLVIENIEIYNPGSFGEFTVKLTGIE